MEPVQRVGLLLVVATFLMMVVPWSSALPPDFFRPVYVNHSPASTYFVAAKTLEKNENVRKLFRNVEKIFFNLKT